MSDSDASSLSDDTRAKQDEYLEEMINLPEPPPPRKDFYCFVCRRDGKRGKVSGFDGLLQHCNTCAIGSRGAHKSLMKRLNEASSQSSMGGKPQISSKTKENAWMNSGKQLFSSSGGFAANAMEPGPNLLLAPKKTEAKSRSGMQTVNSSTTWTNMSSIAGPSKSKVPEPTDKVSSEKVETGLGPRAALKSTQEEQVDR